MTRKLPFVLSLLLAVSGCTATSEDTSTTVTSTSTTTTAPTTTTTSEDACAGATEDMIDAIDILIARATADPAGFLATAETGELADVMHDTGVAVGQECGPEGGGDAYSAIILHIARIQTDDPTVQSFASGLLQGICADRDSVGVELSLPAQAACAGY